MRWTGSASWLLAISSLASSSLACTRGNPAFEDGGDEILDEDSETGPGTEGTDTETGVAAECEYDVGQDLVLEFPASCTETNEQTHRLELNFLVTSMTDAGWKGGWCQIGDDDCSGSCPDDVPQVIELEPFDLSGLISGPTCVRIVAEQSDYTSESCDFDAVGIWAGGKPIFVASNGAAVIGEALAEIGQIAPIPTLIEDPPCECTEECCEVSPGDYQFDIGGQKIDVGDPVQLEAHDYVFHPLKAYNPTGCTGDLKQAWALTYSP